jgi:dTDP-4-amino-4,6-dideoxygalactose transaminase
MAPKKIPVTDPHANYRAHKTAIDAAVARTLDSGWYILGTEVEQFEKEFARWVGTAYCVGVASGTDAVALALRASGVGALDEVITVSHSAVATVAAIEQIGAVPVLVDIDPTTRCMDPERIAVCVGPRTKAIVPVHIYGKMSPMLDIKRIAETFNLKIVEDCAQAHGARFDGANAGTVGNAGCFSFYPTKNLGALGDGGAVVTSDRQIYEQLLALRQYGWKTRYVSALPGFNSRLDEVQAAILRVKLPAILKENEVRNRIANQYDACLAGSSIVHPVRAPHELHAMHLYVVEVDNRDEFEAFMHANGIDTMRHYPLPIHRQAAYAGRIRGEERLGYTEKLYQRIVSLPMFPELPDEDVLRVCAALKNWITTAKGSI